MKTPQNTNQAGFTAVAGAAVIVVLVLIGFTAWRIHDKHHTNTAANNTGSTAATTPSTTTDNGSLKTDLNGINSSLNTENQDNSTAGTALNDQQNEITVPTN